MKKSTDLEKLHVIWSTQQEASIWTSELKVVITLYDGPAYLTQNLQGLKWELPARAVYTGTGNME